MNVATRSTALLWQELRFAVTVLNALPDEYERLFTRIMRLSAPDSFHQARAGGPGGDLGCDGWDHISRTVYAVHAPFSVKSRARARKKVADDFGSALKHWGAEMRNWRLVHNDFFGLRANVVRELEDLRQSESSHGVEILPDWGPQELWAIVRALPDAHRQQLLGGPDWEVVLAPEPLSRSLPRLHEGVPAAAVRATAGSVAHLVGNFQPDSVLDPVCASSFARALVAWWLGDETLWREICELLWAVSDHAAGKMEETAISFAARCLELCAVRLRLNKDGLIAMLLAASAPLHPAERVIIEIVDEILSNGDPDLYSDTDGTRRKLAESCMSLCKTLICMVGELDGFPAAFMLQDLLVSMQRLDFRGGSLLL